jgi:uncharacterized protein Usg
MTKQEFDERLTTIQIYYYIPDYQSLLQEFIWQTVDRQPDFPRSHQFLDHWRIHIEARIHTIYLAHTDFWGKMIFRNVTKEFN